MFKKSEPAIFSCEPSPISQENAVGLAKGRIPSVPTGVGGGATTVATTVITPAAIWVTIVQFLRITDQGLSSIFAKECELLMEPQGHIPGCDLPEFLASMISGQSLGFLPT